MLRAGLGFVDLFACEPQEVELPVDAFLQELDVFFEIGRHGVRAVIAKPRRPLVHFLLKFTSHC